MNILEQIEDANTRFAAEHEREPEEIQITKSALLKIARLLKQTYYPNEVLGMPVVIWSPTFDELKRNGGREFRLE